MTHRLRIIELGTKISSKLVLTRVNICWPSINWHMASLKGSLYTQWNSIRENHFFFCSWLLLEKVSGVMHGGFYPFCPVLDPCLVWIWPIPVTVSWLHIYRPVPSPLEGTISLVSSILFTFTDFLLPLLHIPMNHEWNDLMETFTLEHSDPRSFTICTPSSCGSHH